MVERRRPSPLSHTSLFQIRQPAFWLYTAIVALTGWATLVQQGLFRQISPEGWALSCSSPSLQQILALCPSTVRVGAWVKPFAAFKVGVNPAYAWEPVIFHGGRTRRARDESTVRDWCAASITLQRGLAGAKPDPFCFWVFQMLGLQADDELVDLFPGSGAVSRAWDSFRRQTRLIA